MTTVNKTFGATGNSANLKVAPNTPIFYSIVGTFVATIILERSRNGGLTWEQIGSFTAVQAATELLVEDPGNNDTLVRFRCSAYTSGSAVCQVYDDPAEDNTIGLGTIQAGATSLIEKGDLDGVIHQTEFTLSGESITLTDEAGVGQYGSLDLYDFPAGNIQFLGAVVDANILLDDTEWVDTAEGDVGLGTTAVTDGNALATTEQNIINTTAIAALVAQAGPIDCLSGSTEAGVTVDGTSSPVNLFLNIRIDDNAAHITGTGKITGKVTVTWINLGDK